MGTNWNRPVTGTRFPVPVAQNQELGYLGFGSRFWPKTEKLDKVDTPTFVQLNSTAYKVSLSPFMPFSPQFNLIQSFCGYFSASTLELEQSFIMSMDLGQMPIQLAHLCLTITDHCHRSQGHRSITSFNSFWVPILFLLW